MAWRRDRRDLAGQGAFTREEIEDAERLEWPKGFFPIGEGNRGLDLGLLNGLAPSQERIAILGHGVCPTMDVRNQVYGADNGDTLRKADILLRRS